MLFHRRRHPEPDAAAPPEYPEPAAAPAPAEPPSPAELEQINVVTKLKDLLDAGDLTQAEFDEQRHRLLPGDGPS